ncbi:MAG: cellulase family glycosylhydrolase [Aquabacterium sp.]|uniref:glycoside hydrolase family 5 protein n=1 Tax=Aquabacterium sp. TaxID=1872578 RepID=UPI0025C5986E|nr:cellulase family glycosylhydrolase [Aquabacterium sp.]MBI3380599.1 cellulase family glycosylhydrolase [Aquabacterium sp.]
MPISKVNKSNCWERWNQGLITATNVGGLNIESTGQPQILANLAANRGINAIRLWFAWGNDYTLSPSDFITIAKEGWDTPTLNALGKLPLATIAKQVDHILDVCESLGLGVIFTLDFFKTEGDRLWVDKVAGDDYPLATTALDMQDKLTQFWVATANRWKTRQAVIGYDILNEPAPSQTMSFADLNAHPTMNWPGLASKIAAAIRTQALDTATPLVVQGIYWGGPNGLGIFYDGMAGTATPNKWLVQDAKVVYSFHFYEPGEVTQQGVANWCYEGLGLTYPVGTRWRWYWYNGQITSAKLEPFNTATDMATNCQIALSFKQKYNVPIFVGEFSHLDPYFDINSTLNPADTRISEVNEDDYHRQVTSITADGNTVTVNVENISWALFGWQKQVQDRGAGGFNFGVTNAATTAQLQQWQDNGIDINPYFTNTVLLTVKPIPGSPEADAVNALNIVDQPVKITRIDSKYVFTASKPVTTVARRALATKANGEMYFPAVATLSIKPATSATAMNASRVAFATDVISMCQKSRLSWSWHADDLNTGGFVGWRAGPAVNNVMRQAAMGRRLYK